MFTRRMLGTMWLVSSLGVTSLPNEVAREQTVQEELGLSGYVLGPDGAPVSTGTVGLPSRTGRITTSINGTGRFRIVPDTDGRQELDVIVPGLAPHRVVVAVPTSRTFALPVIRLSAATYFRVRAVSPAGELIIAPRISPRSVDLTGLAISGPIGQAMKVDVDSDGFLTLGPLPRGVTMLALDHPALAPVRLPELYVDGTDARLDGGTVMLDAGATLNVELVDAAGSPVTNHDVFLEDARPLSPLPAFRTPTDAKGRVTFTRLAAAQYRVSTRAVGRCGPQWLTIARLVPVASRGTFSIRIVASGTATFRLAWPYGPIVGATVGAYPDSARLPAPPWLRENTASGYMQRMNLGLLPETSCGGVTDANGQLVLSNFPPGPARIVVRMPNSQYGQRVTIPDDGREIALPIPDGLLPVVVTDAFKKRPVSGATIVWIGRSARIEGRSVSSGDALLEGVAATPGTLEVTAERYERTEVKLAEPPATIHEVTLTPQPLPRLQARVTSTSGESLSGAVLELKPEHPLEVTSVIVTDAKGVATMPNVPPGPLMLVARADGFATAISRFSNDRPDPAVFTLSRGFRAIVSAELPAEAGPQLIRVTDHVGASVDDLLDIASDRRVTPPGRVSLGPLAPGTYVIELHGAGERRQVRVSIVDRDVSVTVK